MILSLSTLHFSAASSDVKQLNGVTCILLGCIRYNVFRSQYIGFNRYDQCVLAFGLFVAMEDDMEFVKRATVESEWHVTRF